MKKFRGVIFDFNGTLFFDGPKHLQAWSSLIEEIRGTSLSEEEKQLVVGPPNLHIIQTCFPHLSKEEAQVLSTKKEAYYRELCRKDSSFTHLVKGAETLFEELKNHDIPFTIASASIQDNIEFFIETFQLNRWFDSSNIVFDDGYHRNKTDMYWHAARNLKIPPEECVIFEDSASGIYHAKQVHAGHICVLCSNEESNDKLALGANETITDFTLFNRSILW